MCFFFAGRIAMYQVRSCRGLFHILYSNGLFVALMTMNICSKNHNQLRCTCLFSPANLWRRPSFIGSGQTMGRHCLLLIHCSRMVTTLPQRFNATADPRVFNSKSL